MPSDDPNTECRETDFLVLVAPLSGDSNMIQTDGVVRAFLFKELPAARICESMEFDTTTDSRSAEEDARRKGAALIRKYHADLIMFGDVRADKAIRLWTMSETGGCDTHPTLIVLEQDFIPLSFSKRERELANQLIATSVAEMSAACNHEQSTDWQALAKRVRKVGTFLKKSGESLTDHQTEEIASSYSDAMGMSYQYGQGEEWFSTASAFNLDRANRVYENDPKSRALWLYAEASLMKARWGKTSKKSDLYASIHQLDQAISLAPSLRLFVLRAVDYRAAGEFTHAIDDFTTAMHFDQNDEGPYFGRGLAWSDKHEYDLAIKDFDTAIRLSPTDYEAYLSRGIEWQRKGVEAKAIEDYDKAIELKPEFGLAYFKRGQVRELDGKFEEAMSDFSEAIRLGPPNALLYSERGAVWRKKGDLDKAIEDYDKAILVNVKFEAAYVVRGEIRQLKGDRSQAIEDFDEAIRLDPTDSGVYLDRALARYGQGSYDAAVADFAISAHLDPTLEAHFQIWRYLSRSRNGDRPSATIELSKASAALGAGKWPYAVVELFLGRRSPADLLGVAGENAERRDDRTCAARYFIGEYYLLEHRLDDARANLALAKQMCQKMLVEFAAAVDELNRLPS